MKQKIPPHKPPSKKKWNFCAEKFKEPECEWLQNSHLQWTDGAVLQFVHHQNR